VSALGFVEEIFSRYQGGPGNVRRVTLRQLLKIEELINEGSDAGAVTRGAPGSFLWKPDGRWKYVVTRDLVGNKHTLTRFAKIMADGMPTLFG
jgi:hypothetical protein